MADYSQPDFSLVFFSHKSTVTASGGAKLRISSTRLVKRNERLHSNINPIDGVLETHFLCMPKCIWQLAPYGWTIKLARRVPVDFAFPVIACPRLAMPTAAVALIVSLILCKFYQPIGGLLNLPQFSSPPASSRRLTPSLSHYPQPDQSASFSQTAIYQPCLQVCQFAFFGRK
ncbi:unnamed protein product [Protopolystoma xenopodis]|uniref:Uncharacterized protein n=1 Tax=Protopolystoma xenopodis TaxID=117903 RepID=A0A3S5BUH2_9PLAT|nr:unnamed protein product [Protopolystoma xenopodis]